MRSSLIFIISFLFVLTSCNKEKRFSKRLMKGEVWQVLNVTIDGNTSVIAGEWQITTDVDIYDSVPQLLWIFDNQDAVCEWQFQDKGKSFQLNYSYLCSEPLGSSLDSLDYFSNDISGKYEVVEHKKKYMEFSSSNTQGFNGQIVEIHMQRVN